MNTNPQDTPLHQATENGLNIAVRETEGLRWLDFGDGGVQSVIDPKDPQRLVSPLNQAMLACLLFIPSPQHTLLLGTGGGAIARFLSARVLDCQGDAVEHSAAVAEIARRFFDFPDTGSGWTLHIAEARDFIDRSQQNYDLILVDIAENQHTPAWLGGHDFLVKCRQRLTPNGVLVLNLLPADASDFAHTLAPIRDTFSGCTACLSLPEMHNILVFGFRRPISTTNVASRLRALEQQWDLPFSDYLQRMQAENPTGSGVF